MKNTAKDDLRKERRDWIVTSGSPMATYLAMAFHAVLKTTNTTLTDAVRLIPGFPIPCLSGNYIAHPKLMRAASVCQKLSDFAPEVMKNLYIGGPLAAYQRGQLQPADFHPDLLAIIKAPVQTAVMNDKNMAQMRFKKFMSFCGLSPFKPPLYTYPYIKALPVTSLIDAIAQETLIQDKILCNPSIHKELARSRALIQCKAEEIANGLPGAIEDSFLNCAKGLMYSIACHARGPVAGLTECVKTAEKDKKGIPVIPKLQRAYWLLRFNTK